MIKVQQDEAAAVSDAVAGASARTLYFRLLRQVRPYWRQFTLAVVGMLLFAATQPGLAALMKPLLDGSFVERDPELVKMMPLLLIGIFIVRGLGSFLDNYFLRWVGRQVVTDLRRDMFRKLLEAPTAFFDRNVSGQLLSKLTYNVENVAVASTTTFAIMVRDGVTVLALLGYMFYINVYLSLVFLILGPTVVTVVRVVARRFRRISQSLQDSVGDITHVAKEVIEGQRVVKAFGGAEVEARRFEAVNDRSRRLNIKIIKTDAISLPVVELITALAMAFIIYLSTMQAIQDDISIGTFMSFLIAMGLLMDPVRRLTSINSHLQKGIAAAQSIFDLLAEAPERDLGKRSLERCRGLIEYRHVSHSYAPGQAPALKDLNLRLEPGQTLAIVGQSGSGKTTLANLLPRFYDASEGEICIDGINIRQLSLAGLRRQIALVSQEVVLFNDTVAANIAYGERQGASREAIVDAARAAHALDFIQALPGGFDTPIGERGSLLSGGQRQRIAIARAMLKNAPILILDEATSALDSQSEQHIQAALRTLMRERTTLVIAHRLSTIERADHIIVLDQGRLVEQGRHENLLAQRGLYARLYRMQFRQAMEARRPEDAL